MDQENDNRIGLEALGGMAAAVDAEVGGLTPENFEAGAPAGAPAGPMVPAGPDYGAEAAACVEIFAGLVCGVAPKAAAIWTPEARERTGAALAPVMAKYGVSLGAIPPELTLAVVAGPLLWQSARAVAAQVEESQAEAARRRREAGQGVAMEANPAPESGLAPAPIGHEQMALYGQGA